MTCADYALINATWTHLTDKNFQCQKIYDLYKKRKDWELVTKLEKAKRGCGTIKDTVKIEMDGIAYHSCLCHPNFQHPLFNTLLVLSEKYEKGILPYSGGVMDQPAQVIEMLSLISKLKQELELEQQKEAAKQSKGKK